MPRRARLAPWHIIQRGNNRSARFHITDDYHRYLETLQQQAVVHGCSRYRELFRVHLEPGLVDEIRQATNGNYALGTTRFREEIETMLN